ncbi:unnamed protein product [Meloidogyne enterolobii]
MDHMGFGMGLCCLQMTFQAVNVQEARWLYDQLTIITPVMVALTTPIFRSYLSDLDSRWDIISASVDDRTNFERGKEPSELDSTGTAPDGYSLFKNIPKSRYDSTDCYIYPCSAPYNDLPLQYQQKHYQQLVDGGVDEYLARHFAHMFIRDPLQVFKERIEQDDQRSTEHFETIQSSNWMNMRFKPPPPDAPEIGWRVEFRPTEVQLTNFENAAYCCFLFRSKMANCQHTPEGKPCTEGQPPAEPEPDYNTTEMTIDEIVNGNSQFSGLAPLIRQFLDGADVDVDTRCTINQYLSFIQKRAKGEIMTTASWMRSFVQNHSDYKHNSYVSDEIIYDLLKKMDGISRGDEHCEKLLGCYKSKTDQRIPQAVRLAEEKLTRELRRHQ